MRNAALVNKIYSFSKENTLAFTMPYFNAPILIIALLNYFAVFHHYIFIETNIANRGRYEPIVYTECADDIPDTLNKEQVKCMQ